MSVFIQQLITTSDWKCFTVASAVCPDCPSSPLLWMAADILSFLQEVFSLEHFSSLSQLLPEPQCWVWFISHFIPFLFTLFFVTPVTDLSFQRQTIIQEVSGLMAGGGGSAFLSQLQNVGGRPDRAAVSGDWAPSPLFKLFLKTNRKGDRSVKIRCSFQFILHFLTSRC